MDHPDMVVRRRRHVVVLAPTVLVLVLSALSVKAERLPITQYTTPDLESDTIRCALEDRLPAMRTGAGGSGATRANATHELVAISMPCFVAFEPLLSSQPNSAA